MIVLRFVATGYDYVPELVSRPDTNHQTAISGQFLLDDEYFAGC